ncbi:lipid-A-disaccharide synthase [Niveibacterium sp. 24ML]|uniref:lipid-A-disaccharide synthase n=1 Tax=Niveibacterium sp. 24ML TaxID=2985512 RepID=UPI00226E2A7E|nr:lipid-A-disaccharide synthase [Niveibacterium sp. 24ML]MCX9156568.1 lipid-A-disaccharide synthase [Niveibacterium sp. 24ML]
MSACIAMVAGEASGDLLGSRLILALKRQLPDVRFVGIGGPAMEREGLESWFPAERLAVNGIVDALGRVPELLGIRHELIARIKAESPLIFIGIDAPDFNLGVERRLKASGIPTVHYVSPSVWMWRAGRIKKIRRSADHILCLFPFEPELYQRAGVAATYVGHPLADEFELEPNRMEMRERLCLPRHAEIVALLPGSRNGEVSRLAADFVGAAKLIHEQRPDTRFLAPFVTRETRSFFEQAMHEAGLPKDFPITLMFGHSHDAMIAADVVLLASGTATLEAALLKRPMVIAYKMPAWQFGLVRRLMYLPYVGLPNILCKEFVVPERLQERCEPVGLAEDVIRWLADKEATAALSQRFTDVHLSLRQDNASKAAAAICGMLGGRAR